MVSQKGREGAPEKRRGTGQASRVGSRAADDVSGHACELRLRSLLRIAGFTVPPDAAPYRTCSIETRWQGAHAFDMHASRRHAHAPRRHAHLAGTRVRPQSGRLRTLPRTIVHLAARYRPSTRPRSPFSRGAVQTCPEKPARASHATRSALVQPSAAALSRSPCHPTSPPAAVPLPPDVAAHRSPTAARRRRLPPPDRFPPAAIARRAPVRLP